MLVELVFFRLGLVYFLSSIKYLLRNKRFMDAVIVHAFMVDFADIDWMAQNLCNLCE